MYQSIYQCKMCDNKYTSQQSINAHMRTHSSFVFPSKIKCSCIYTQNEVSADYLSKYQAKLTKCKTCISLIHWSKTFCNASCSATYNNTNRVQSQETKDKISKALRKPKEPKYKNCPVYYNYCKKCNKLTLGRTYQKFCTDCKDGYLIFKFRFNVFHYPSLFDLDQVKAVGFYGTGGNSGNINPTGLSRDHRVSVSESILNSYEPFYITHPLNCELMPHSENNKKGMSSSISYEELKALVDEYEMRRGQKSNL